MTNDINPIDELIGKYLADEATARERGLLESWINESAENRDYFHQLQTIFEKATIDSVQNFDTDKAWAKVKMQLKQSSNGRTVALNASRLSRNFMLRIAAGVIFVLGVGYMSYRILPMFDAPVREIIATNSTRMDSLPDGSTVVLNRQSRLNYEFDKAANAHTVRLQGEAFFEIGSTDEADFIVEADGIFIRDIGTSFNVKAYPDKNRIEVVVEEGEVMFFTKADPGIHIQKDQKGIFDKTTEAFTIETADPNASAYKDRSFIFADADLQSVVNDLNNVYEKQILISENLANCRVTVSFRNEDIDEIAAVIAETLGLERKTTAQGIVLEGVACEQ